MASGSGVAAVYQWPTVRVQWKKRVVASGVAVGPPSTFIRDTVQYGEFDFRDWSICMHRITRTRGRTSTVVGTRSQQDLPFWKSNVHYMHYYDTTSCRCSDARQLVARYIVQCNS